MLNQLNKSIEKIHNYIYANDGLDNYEVLTELLKIFYIKTYDEINENLISNCKSEKELVNTVNTIYSMLIDKYPALFSDSKKIELKPESIIFIFKELSTFEISKINSDLKGHLMQRIIDRSFREGRGQFFTPASVVDFIVKMIDPKPEDKGCDPACGTGGFMFAALENMAIHNLSNVENYIKNVDFYDISKSVTKIIAMRFMFEFAIDKPNIKIQDSISSDIPAVYDFVLTNPPFGSQGRISDKKILAKYTLGHDGSGKILSSQVPDILFVEKVISILKNGGKGAIVLPDGNFENPTSKYFRDFLIQNCKIDAIVSLPDGTFIPYGTGVKSSILFFTKMKNINYDYNVFFGKINNLGYTFSKHSKSIIDREGNIIEDYTQVIASYKNKKHNLDNFEVNIQDIIANNSNFAYNFFSPRINTLIKNLINGSSVRIKDVATIETKKIKINPDKLYKYVEISDLNAKGCEIINATDLMGSELPSRASYELKEGQVIVAVSGNAVGTEWNTKALVSNDYDGCICTNGFNVVNAVHCSPYLLLHFFNSEAFRIQVRKYRYGTAIPTISREDFMNIIIPNYSVENTNTIIQNTKRAIELRKEAKMLLEKEY